MIGSLLKTHLKFI